MNLYTMISNIEDYPLLTTQLAKENRLDRIMEIESSILYLETIVINAELTEIEQTILDCLFDGMNKKSIARHLSINRKTVSSYIFKIAEKLITSHKEVMVM